MVIATIRGKQHAADALKQIVNGLEGDGHTVYYDHLLNVSQESLDGMKKEDNLKFHKKILERIRNADMVVAEVSCQSLSVGYLIAHAVELGKPTIIVYKSSSPEPNLMPTLTYTGKILLAKYDNINDLSKLAVEYVNYAKERVDVRFNFFISPEIGVYLDWVSLNKKVPRSVYLRSLIERDMDENEEYKRD